jgi:DNA uptake protein ComE-like DNA-binding protein
MTRRSLPSVRAAVTPLLLAAVAATLAACSAKERDPGVDDTAQADSGAASVPGIPPGAPTTAGAASDSATMANAPAAGGTDVAATGAGQAAAGALLDPNTATREQLVGVQGMTPGAADALIAGRPYANMLAVDAALTKAQLDSTARRTVYGRVFRPIDLNAATGPEILLIPGVGPRMRHEFEEYRPYRNIERFRREIGKYVDQAEVARLERYVSIR